MAKLKIYVRHRTQCEQRTRFVCVRHSPRHSSVCVCVCLCFIAHCWKTKGEDVVIDESGGGGGGDDYGHVGWVRISQCTIGRMSIGRCVDGISCIRRKLITRNGAECIRGTMECHRTVCNMETNRRRCWQSKCIEQFACALIG